MMLPCAIYTRKSSEEGLEQNFNSLDAQREACAAYILSQKSQGWKPVKEVYDDGGFSGGNMQRPALKRLMEDVTKQRVKVIVVYKVDRLTRSLADFAKLVELFNAKGVSFVSVTQQFNTTTSMGRLTLNVLLSFAQFEREVTGERIRDKIAASKRKGLWMGGIAPIGYRPHERTLVIEPAQARQVQAIFALYLELGCVSRLKAELDRRGWVTPARTSRRANCEGERAFSRGHLHRILKNPIYIGRVPHRGVSYAAEHPAIIEQAVWESVQEQLAGNLQGVKGRSKAASPSLLAGLVFDEEGNRFTPSHARKGARRYRYYVSTAAKPMRLPAQELEQAVMRATIELLTNESRLLAAMEGVGADEIREGIQRASELARRLEASTPAQITNLVQVLERITIYADRLVLAIRSDALGRGQSAFEIDVPAQLKRYGMAMRLVVNVPGAAQRCEPDQKLVALIAQAQEWFRLLASGNAASPEEIAGREGCTASYVVRVVQLAFLAPDVVDRIARGDQPAELSATKLAHMLPLPVGWADQRSALGMQT